MYGWHTWRRRLFNDFCWVGSTKFTFINLVIVETTFLQNFVVDQRPTTSFLPALRVTENYACVYVCPSSISFSDLKLSVIIFHSIKPLTYSVSLSQPQSHMGISAVMAKEIHTLNAPRSRSELFLTTAALDGVFVMRAHRCYIHHGGDHKIWRESANTALLREKKQWCFFFVMSKWNDV